MSGPKHLDENLIDVVSRRLDFLERLGEVALEKREMVHELGHSRSTVNRAIAELEDAGLVTATADGHVTTLTGKLAADMYRRVLSDAADIRTTMDVLAPLTAVCPVGLELISGADVERTDGPPPYRSVERLRDTVRDAERVRALLPTVANVETLRVCHSRVIEEGMTAEMLMSPPLFERLASQFPAVFRQLALGGAYTALTADLPPFTTFLVEESGTVTVAVIVYSDGNAIQGVLVNDTPAAVRWAEDLYSRLRTRATNRTRELGALETDEASSRSSFERTADRSKQADRQRTHATEEKTADEAASDATARQGGDRSDDRPIDGSVRAELEASGFVRLDEAYLGRREPAPPATCWRTGLDLVEVSAGYAIDREYAANGETKNLTQHLVERLGDGADHVVVGPPGSGKSTVCKSVACRWHEQRLGDVFYRESGSGATFDAPAVLAAHLREVDGHALVVVEDAVRAEANAVFELMREFSGDAHVTFLLDAREEEWQRPQAFPTDAGLEAYRHDAIETFEIPGLDETECRRLVRRFTETVEGSVEPPVEEFLQRIRDDAERDATDARPGEILLVLHWLSAYADPLARYGSPIPTTLTQDIQQTYEHLQEVDIDLTLDVGLTVNLLNAAGIGVYPDLVHALADADQHDAVRRALALLEGRVVFPGERSSGGTVTRYRTIHESWSRLFVKHLLTVESARDARERFGRCVSALLSLADDPQLRERIDWEFEGDAAYVGRIAVAPEAWAEGFVHRLFALGQDHPSIAPLFGKTDYSHIELPDVCSTETVVRCTEWRGEMFRRAERHDWATREFERLEALVTETDEIDRNEARRLTALSLNRRGEVDMHRGDLETAEEYMIRALDDYRELDDTAGAAASLLRLGIISWTRGDYSTAEERIARSLEAYCAVGDRRGESACLGNLAAIALENGTLDAAEQYATRSLDIRRAIGAELGEADCLLLLGDVALGRDALDAAEEYVTRSFEIAHELGARRAEASSLSLLGEVERRREAFEAAVEYVERSLAIWQETGIDHGEAECLRTLGHLARERRAFEAAERYLTRSLELVRDLGARHEEAATLFDLGELAQEAGEYERASERFEAVVEMERESATPETVVRSRRKLVELCELMGDVDAAVTHCETALEAARTVGLDEVCEACEADLDRLSEEVLG